jgi:hypothetical protein
MQIFQAQQKLDQYNQMVTALSTFEKKSNDLISSILGKIA